MRFRQRWRWPFASLSLHATHGTLVRHPGHCVFLPTSPSPALRSSPRPIRPAIPIATLTLESSRQAVDITPAMTMPWRDCSAPCRQRHDKRKTPPYGSVLLESGAGNETRTRDLNLGKVALYQLSYSRRFRSTCVEGALLCRYCCTASTGIFACIAGRRSGPQDRYLRFAGHGGGSRPARRCAAWPPCAAVH